MNSYINHQVTCDLCDDDLDSRLDGVTTECGTVVCEACCDNGAVRFHYTEDECFIHLNDD